MTSQVDIAPYRPDQSTIERFDEDQVALCAACNEWLNTVLHPPAQWADESDCEFSQLTQALQLWASLHGLGDGVVLSGKDVGQGLAFIQLIENRALWGLAERRGIVLSDEE
jgi:hypothetical protein